ncbi:MAG: M48 family metalloprotease [Acidobacteriota bacterium]
MRGGRWLLGLALAAMAVLAYVGGKSPRLGAMQVDLSPEQEVALGLQSTPELELRFGGLDADPAVQQRVQAVGERVVSQSVAASTPYDFHFYVLADMRTVNAFALPGGPVFITRALLSRLGNEAQLAGVLGHQVGHLVARHSNPARGLRDEADAADDEVSRTGEGHTATMSDHISRLKYSRDDELEADELGVQMMSEAGYDPRALVGVMAMLAQATSGGRPPEFLRTHPDPGNRAERIQNEIARRFPDGVPEGLTLGAATPPT